MARPTGVTKLTNGYVRTIPLSLYEAIPKAVWAAMAISALTNGGEWLEDAAAHVTNEWCVLHLNGIVPQKPPAHLLERFPKPAPKSEIDW